MRRRVRGPGLRPGARRALSLLELILAMTITMMVAAAIAGMLGAVAAGVGSRRDSRTVMVLANASESRLSAYIAPSRCILSASGTDLTLWLNDARAGETVHATEIRWLLFDAATGEIDVHFVHFPDSWTQTAKDLEDQEYPATTNWSTVLAAYQAAGWTDSRTLVDRVAGVDVSIDNAAATDARHVEYALTFDADTLSVPVSVAATIRLHDKPVR